MRTCVVLGCGRSGTSLVAGVLAAAGWHLGERLLAADPSNAKGYFEDRTVNALNERLLSPVTGAPPPGAARPLAEGERWLAVLPPDVVVPPRPDLAAAQAAAACAPDGRPVCRKDPRFTWTLPLWAPLADAVRVVVFREPLAAARSIVRMQDDGTLGLPLSGALQVWQSAYRRVLALSERDGASWVFVSHEQAVTGRALPRLAAVLGVDALPGDVADPRLRTSDPHGEVPDDVAALYRELLGRSEQAVHRRRGAA